MTLILASTSTYRRALLARLHLPFTVEDPAVDETPSPAEAPEALARRLALAKAAAVAGRHPAAVVIGSDQVATLDGVATLGKPGTVARAVEQLRAASGREMRFYTAVAVCAPGQPTQVGVVPVTAVFRPLTDAEIRRYVALEMPLDCAGAAKSEGLGIALLARMTTDDPTALVGLPLIRLAAMLREVGIDPLASAGRSDSDRP